MKDYVCIDIGGTFIKHGLANEEGHFLQKGSVATEIKERGVSGFLGQLSDIVANYEASRGIAGIAISSPGIVDADKGEILFVGDNFPGFSGTKLKREMEERCGIPCQVENDVNAAGLGECWLGAGRGIDSVVCVAVGTGIGGCVILNGELLHGAANCAGEVGYLSVGGGRILEQEGSTASLLRKIAAKRGIAPGELTGEQIFAEALAGKGDAIEAIDEMVQWISLGLSNICCLLNPRRIILGGGIAAQEEYLRPRLEAALRERLTILPLRDSTELVFAKLRNDAAMLGALRHFLQKQRRKS